MLTASHAQAAFTNAQTASGTITMSEVFAFWVNDVNDGGAKTVPGASFWGFVSCPPGFVPFTCTDEDFNNATGRQDGLDPVNVIFFTSDSSPALDVAANALRNSGWKENACISANLFAYFDGAPVARSEQDLHLHKLVDGCLEKFHIRLFQPVVNSSWAIGAAHRECTNGTRPECPDPIPIDTVFNWEGAENLVKADVMTSGLAVDNWNADLNNTDGAQWRSIPNDGIAAVFELACPLFDPTAANLDCDGDGWTDLSEVSFIGTDPLDDCADNSSDDANPADFNNDASFTGFDLSAVAADIGQSVPPAPARKDIAPDPPDGAITGADLSAVAARIGQSCV